VNKKLIKITSKMQIQRNACDYIPLYLLCSLLQHIKQINPKMNRFNLCFYKNHKIIISNKFVQGESTLWCTKNDKHKIHFGSYPIVLIKQKIE